MYQVTTAYTATARVQPVKPFDDKRVRQALRFAIDSNAVLQIAHRGLASPASTTTSAPCTRVREARAVHPRRRQGQKAARGGGLPERHRHRDHLPAQPAWELLAVQAMVEQWKEPASG